MNLHLDTRARLTLALCLFAIVLSANPQGRAQKIDGDIWTNWMSYIYVVRDDGSARVTVVSHALVDITTAEYLERHFDQNRSSQLEVAKHSIIGQELAIADRLQRKLVSEDLTLQSRRIQNLFVIEISWIWRNFVLRKENSWTIDALGVVSVGLEDKGNLTVTLPKSVNIISVSLKEDERTVAQDSVKLVWRGPRANVDPVIEYSVSWLIGATGLMLVIAMGGGTGACLLLVSIVRRSKSQFRAVRCRGAYTARESIRACPACHHLARRNPRNGKWHCSYCRRNIN